MHSQDRMHVSLKNATKIELAAMHLRSRSLVRQTQHVAVPAAQRKRAASRATFAVTPDVKAEVKMEATTPSSTKDTTDLIKVEQLDVVKLEYAAGLDVMKEEPNGYDVIKEEKAPDDVDEAQSAKKLKLSDVKPPTNWKATWDGIVAMRADKTAAVDGEGCETFNDSSLDPPVRRFHVLIACMLSSQTKDPVTAAAMGRLRSHGLTVASMLAMKQSDLAAILRPVGFFNNKAKYIQQTCTILQTSYGSDIPSTFDGLIALPGVGPKMAHLTMSCAWNNTVGICVDIHVHRITNRLGWVKTWAKGGKSQDPEKTRKELEDWLPREHWNDINVLLVGFGQQICTPLRPKCESCQVNHLCPSAFKKASP